MEPIEPSLFQPPLLAVHLLLCLGTPSAIVTTFRGVFALVKHFSVYNSSAFWCHHWCDSSKWFGDLRWLHCEGEYPYLFWSYDGSLQPSASNRPLLVMENPPFWILPFLQRPLSSYIEKNAFGEVKLATLAHEGATFPATSQPISPLIVK